MNSMSFDEYQIQAFRTMNAGLDRIEMLTNAALGVCGEAGEVADHVKKALFQGHSLDTEVIKKELGDVLWYIACMAHVCGIKLSEVAELNIKKLRRRYPDGFTTERSIHREE